MGTLKYSRSASAIVLSDRTLEHLHIVLTRLFRHHQRIALDVISDVSGPVQVWLDARIPLIITHASGVASTINDRWLNELEASFSHGRLVLMPEPTSPSIGGREHPLRQEGTRHS